MVAVALAISGQFWRAMADSMIERVARRLREIAYPRQAGHVGSRLLGCGLPVETRDVHCQSRHPDNEEEGYRRPDGAEAVVSFEGFVARQPSHRETAEALRSTEMEKKMKSIW